MSGVMFFICVPSEQYEKLLVGNKENVSIEPRKTSFQHQESLESDESSSSTSKVSFADKKSHLKCTFCVNILIY